MTRTKAFGRAIKGDKTIIATFSIIPRPEIVELAAQGGFDAVILDLEHGPFELGDLTAPILAARANGVYPVIRVRSNDPANIGAALDIGAAGVIVPQIDSVEAARRAIQAAHYAPQGSRGVNPWVRAFNYCGTGEDLARANTDTGLVLLVESQLGLDALPEILELEGVDCVFLGPVDMAHSLGFPGQPNHPQVVAAIASVVGNARERGVATGVFAPDAGAAAQWLEIGVPFVAVSEDSALIGAAYRELHAALRPAARR